MFVIAVYDIKQERVVKIYKYCKRYLYHRQKSVFDGEMDKSVLNEFVEGLRPKINEEEDSVLIYVLEGNFDEIIQLGIEKIHEEENIIPPGF